MDTQLADTFYEPDGDLLVPTVMTRGPWDDRFQHGGPPAAALTGAMERYDGDDEFALVRMAIELLKPVPLAPMRIELRPDRLGRTVQRLEAALLVEETVVVLARGLRIRRSAMDFEPSAEPPDPWPDPDSVDDYLFSFFRNEVGYHRGVQLRVVRGAWGSTPIALWTRPRIPLVAGQATSPRQRLMILADAQSGMGVPLDPLRYAFLNPDLTVYFEREPRDGWLGFDIRSTVNTEGAGLAQSAIRDEAGVVARSAQSLVVSKR